MQQPHIVEFGVVHLIDGIGELIAFQRSPQIAIFKLPRRLELASQSPVSPVGKMCKRPRSEAVALQLPQEQGP